MNIATIGRGNVGGSLGELWRAAGHEVTELGHEGGDVSEAEVVLVAPPGGAIVEALDGVSGLDGKMSIDATNIFGGATRPEGFDSVAEYVKSVTGAPTAKSFNINFADIFARAGQESTPPGNFWCGDEETRGTVETLSRDAGYEAVFAGPLGNARMQEDILPFIFAIAQDGGMGQFYYRCAPPA